MRKLKYPSLLRNTMRYRIEGNFGGCKLWQIRYKNAVGEINFGEFERL